MASEKRRANDAPLAWIDGRIVAADKPGVPVLDQAYLTGMGVFETMRAAGGRVLFLEAHWQRLKEAAGMFGLEVPTLEVVGRAVGALLEKQGLKSARVRVVLSGTGAANGAPFRFGGTARMVVLAFPLPPARAAAVRMVTADIRVHAAGPLAGKKCTSYAVHALATHEARCRGADEALLLNHRGDVCGGAVSNIFWVLDGKIWTPSLKCGCRDGVTRARVIAACGRLGLELREVAAKRDAPARADEVFLTSTLRGVRRVAMLDGNRAGDAGIASMLRERLRREALRGKPEI